jgi:tetratricopeptide (TPR) repeat protein
MVNVAWILAAGRRRVLIVDWSGESPQAADYLRPFLVDHLPPDDALGPRLAAAHATVSSTLGGTPSTFVERYSLAGTPGWIDLLGSTFGVEQLSEGEHSAVFSLRQLLLQSEYDYVLFDCPISPDDTGTATAEGLSDIAVVCFAARQRMIGEAAELAAKVRAASPREVDVVPVTTMFDERHMARPERALGAIRAAFADVLATQHARLPPRGVVEIPYQPYDAFDPLLTVLIDDPEQDSGVVSAYTQLTGIVTDQAVSTLEPLTGAARVRYRRACGLDPAAEPIEVLLAYMAKSRPWADWVRTQLEEAGARVDTLPPEPRRSSSGPLYVALIEPDAPQRSILQDRVAEFRAAARDAGRDVDIVRMRTSREYETPPAADSVILAGGGEQQARIRLLAHFGLVDQRQPASRNRVRFPTLEPPTVELPPRNPHFVGRDKETELIRDTLGNSAPTSSTIELAGPTGIGKSELALEYAYRFGFDYDIVWWLPAHDSQSILESIRKLADRIHAPTSNPALETLDVLVADTNRTWLMIYDNVDDPAVLEGLLPEGGNGHVLITTSVMDGARAPTITLTELGLDDSARLLTGTVTTLAAADARAVAEEVHHLPLALDLAAAWVAEESGRRKMMHLGTVEATAWAATAFVDRLRVEPDSTPGAAPPSIENRVMTIVTETLKSTVLGRVTVLLAELCSFLSPQGVSITMLRAKAFWNQLIMVGGADTAPLARDTSELDRVLWLGARFGLFRVDWGRYPMVRMHRAVQAALRETMGPTLLAQRRNQILTALAAYAPTDVDNDLTSGLRRYEELRKHIVHSGALDSNDEAVRLWMVNQIRYSYVAGGPTRVRITLRTAEYLSERWTSIWGTSDPLMLRLMAQQANIYRLLGDNRTALRMDTAALARQRRSLQLTHPQALVTARGRGGDLRGMGLFTEALSEDESTWDGFRQVLGGDHPHTRSAANNLALSMFLSGDALSALALEEDNYARRRRLFGLEDTDTWWSLCSVGIYLRELGRYNEAIESLRFAREHLQVLRPATETLGLRIQLNYAITERFAGRPAVAKDRNVQTLHGYRELLGSAHPWTVGCAASLAMVYRVLGDSRRAARLTDDCVSRYRDDVGLDEHHPFIALGRVSLAQHLLACGDVMEAAEVSTMGKDSLRTRLGSAHPWALAADVNHAGVLSALGDDTAAVELVGAAYARLREFMGDDHPYTRAAERNFHRTAEDWVGIDIDVPQT